ncbi:hypothetical protein J2S17_003111 [Cytobacillus purgationiresistens]|uniref:Uncharacterized protein n=2 Tax=Cytobacillus purgationiresistens TaxID=863449 RepID=A0ABU0AIX9_9BACI|nr:hypothetical protein [Cytobacillus purgationiresistens]
MIDNDEAEPLLVLFACLTKRFKQNLGETTREKVIAIESVMLETPVSKMPPYADDIPEGSIFVQLSKEEFERLVNIAKEDPKTSYLYTYRLDETIT